MFIAENLKVLRRRLGKTQQELAIELGIKRPALNSYEQSIAVPPVDLLLRMAEYYKTSLDRLIKVDLGNNENIEEESSSDIDSFTSGARLRILTRTIDSENRENIEMVPLKAMAGYTLGYNDPEYVSSLPTFQLPFLSAERKYRAFQLSGDSMLPIKSGSYVVGEFVQDWRNIKDGNAYVILTNDDGAVFKVVFNEIRKKKNLLLKSLNPMYQPYEVPIEEVKEIWRFVNYFSFELPDTTLPMDELQATVLKLKEDMEALKKKD